MLPRWLRNPRSASGWFARLHRGTASPRTETRFQRWLESDPRNARQYDHQELVWTVAGELEHDPDIEALVGEADTDTSSPTHRSHLHLGFAAIACATLIIVAVGGVVFLKRADRDPLYTTSIGEERQVVLPDHSAMTLNTATRVRVSYGKSRRAVVLEQGEATFNVIHDPARPFVVIASGGTARALGTQFNVLTAAGTITVAVLEGRVAVTAAPNPHSNAALPPDSVVVGDGEQVSFAGEKLGTPQPANIARIQGWHIGRIVMKDMTLSDAIAEFNRYSRVPLRLGNPSLATLRITGVFRSGEPDAFLDAVEEAFGLHVERTATAITLH